MLSARRGFAAGPRRAPEAVAALAAISCRHLSASGLGRLLGVSRASAARTLARLRAGGVDIVSVRTADGWHYEWRDGGVRMERRWEALRRLRGFVAGRRGRLKPEDEEIYGS